MASCHKYEYAVVPPDLYTVAVRIKVCWTLFIYCFTAVCCPCLLSTEQKLLRDKKPKDVWNRRNFDIAM